MNAKVSVFFICVEVIIYWLLYNLHDCTFKKRLILFKAFIELQFEYCPLVWMFHGSQINDKIRHLKIKTKKKVVLFPEIRQVKTFLSLTRWHRRTCIRIYIFNFKKQITKQKNNPPQKNKKQKQKQKQKQTNKQKQQQQQKQKKLKKKREYLRKIY